MIRRPGLAVLAAALAAGCATKSDVTELDRSMAAEIQSVRARQDSLSQELRRLQAVILDSLGAGMERMLAQRGESHRRLEELESRLGRLMALAGQNQRVLGEIRSGLRTGTISASTTAGSDSAGGRAPPADTASGTVDEARELYRASLQQFRRGSYQTARTGLKEFLSRFPRHSLAPDAQYYLAETFAEADSLAPALEEYARILELFPGSSRAPAALYKSGQIELERGNVEEARSFFSRVVRGYPNSDEADLAEQQLDRLQG